MDLKIERIADNDGGFLHYDIVMQEGSLQTVTGAEEIGNRIICNLMVYIGENFTDTSFGTDYHNNVFGFDITDIIMIDTLKAGILNTRGVVSVDEFSLTLADDRTAQLTAKVKTTEGEIELTTPIQI